MKFRTLEGGEANIYLKSYAINWRGPSASKFQYGVKQFLFENFKHLDFFEEVRLCGGLSDLRVDFMCRYEDFKGATKFAIIEADGIFHYQQNTFFTKTEEDFLQMLERDASKERFAEINGIPLLRIYPDHDLDIDFFNEHFNFILPLAC